MEASNAISRADFDENFFFGASSSAYQIEGATDEGGRGTGIWDTWIADYPYYIVDGTNAKQACESYKKYKDDVKLLKKIGLGAYRFSISWPRILPGGKLSAGINEEGINYYNDLIDELVANGIRPIATLFHWDLPQALEDGYLGFLGRQIVDDFAEFAELCFWEFGDRVKDWITFNEPTSFVSAGYVTGVFPPGRGIYSPNHTMQTLPQHRACKYLDMPPVQPTSSGDPSREPYLVAHHILLAHAEVVQLYRKKFKVQRGRIGMSLVTEWYEPLHNTPVDKEAVERALDFSFGWFMLPLVEGRYPKRMVERVGHRLPIFSHEEIKKLVRSYDFLGLNYYSGQYATNDSSSTQQTSYLTDRGVTFQNKAADGKTLIGPMLGTSDSCYYPDGLYHLLCRIKSDYGHPRIIITENGVDQKTNPNLTMSQVCKDPERIQYIQGHLEAIKKAIHVNGVHVQGYIVWSLLDDFEWIFGYTKRYGMVYVDFKNGFTRCPKDSAIWYMDFIDKQGGKAVPLPLPILSSKRAMDFDNDQQNPKEKAIRRS